ncbi:unnamed protein product [Microthlaspi erraticum]|uniref:DC1 domain-containing protein n=1 Tax=Microthlaspi erraticum TaxID=1685480 RepID=A0A6D2KQX2_9BRAS|nr:unnamed protein product [Microthlaspi erraticum]
MPSGKPSVRHPSHSHPLRGHKAQVEEEIICSGCDLDVVGAAFKCTKSDCDYFLHKSCFDLPRETRHKSHPDHPLTLLYSPTYESSAYSCDACGEDGSGFAYNCSICKWDLHVGCAFMPELVEREGHAHPLKLLYGTPCKNGSVFSCDVCQETMPDNLWLYYCKKCDYGTHLHSCAVEEKEEPKRGGGNGRGSTSNGGNKGGRGSAASELAAMLKAQRDMEKMQIELHLQMQRAKIDKKSRKSILNSI